MNYKGCKPPRQSDTDSCVRFQLKGFTQPYEQKNNKRLIITKGSYHPKIKVTGWNDYYSALPFDNNPYDPIKLTTSHYNRFGGETCACYSTTTSDMMKQHKLKHIFINKFPDKKIYNYFSFKDTKSCTEPPAPPKDVLPEVCAMDYNTTMHESYTPPYPYAMQRLAVPKVSASSTRRGRQEDPKTCPYKYYDEEIPEIIAYLQCHKGFKYKSYDFCKHQYTDGSMPKKKTPVLYTLEYAK